MDDDGYELPHAWYDKHSVGLLQHIPWRATIRCWTGTRQQHGSLLSQTNMFANNDNVKTAFICCRLRPRPEQHAIKGWWFCNDVTNFFNLDCND
jgi:hypothetical protein